MPTQSDRAPTCFDQRCIIFLLYWGEANYAATLFPDMYERSRSCAVQHRSRVCGSKTFYFCRDVHRAELGTAHRTEMRVLESLLRERFIMHGTRRFGIEREIELAVPIESI